MTVDQNAELDAELDVEEGDPNLIYDDATGKPFVKGMTLQGNLSVGVGLNLMVPFDQVELQFLEQHRIGKVQTALQTYAWYADQDPVRQNALADIAYNIGVNGLLHWPHFLSYMANKDYPSAVGEIKSNSLWISQVKAARAGRLETMILTGNWPPDIVVPGEST
jgi:GH24 family phage-related lysozyme (muramidase)